MFSVDGGEIVAARLDIFAALQHDRFISQFDQTERGKHSSGTGSDDGNRILAMHRGVVLGALARNVLPLDDVVLQADDYIPTARIHRALERHDNPTSTFGDGELLIQRRNEQRFVEGFGRRQD